jgi:mRNA interferase MazF
MGALAAGSVVLVPFPFSDLSQSKLRPAVCLADAGRNDWILCQVTSSPYGDPHSIALEAADFSAGGLHLRSYVRPAKLFTAHGGLIVRSVGTLTVSSHQRVIDEVVQLLQPPPSP